MPDVFVNFGQVGLEGNLLLVAAVALPTAVTLLCAILSGRGAEWATFSAVPMILATVIGIALRVAETGKPLVYVVGAWAPPLGIVLKADGISAAMLLTTALLITAVALYVPAEFRDPPGTAGTARRSYVFWTLLAGLWTALNVVFLAGDLFTLFVALELLTFAAVPLVCIDGTRATLEAALRYLLFALLGSVLYLLGVTLLYGSYGTLDITLLAQRVVPITPTLVAGALMTAGLLAKCALFPLHLWLPPAHAGAPSAASALLSGLVVKAAFILLVRLWFEVMPTLFPLAASNVLAVCGTGAILVGSVMALRQSRLKLLIAYSTVAQIGYLFLMFPLASDPAQPWAAMAWSGGLLQAVSHALAKAAMFMATGLIIEATGSDRISNLFGMARVLPITIGAIGIGGLSLMGVPVSGGFAAKWMLLRASIASDQWWWAVVVLGGGLLAGGYMFRAIAPGLMFNVEPKVTRGRVAPGREAVAMGLALASFALGLVPLYVSGFLQIGHPEFAAGASR